MVDGVISPFKAMAAPQESTAQRFLFECPRTTSAIKTHAA